MQTNKWKGWIFVLIDLFVILLFIKLLYTYFNVHTTGFRNEGLVEKHNDLY